MKNVLFICTANVDRSPTAECVFANYPGLKTKSAGISEYAKNPVTTELLNWADVVFCMGSFHKQYLLDKYPEDTANKEINLLDIPDRYTCMESSLIILLREKMEPWLGIYRQNGQ